jgi:hypothetical protein
LRDAWKDQVQAMKLAENEGDNDRATKIKEKVMLQRRTMDKIAITTLDMGHPNIVEKYVPSPPLSTAPPHNFLPCHMAMTAIQIPEAIGHIYKGPWTHWCCGIATGVIKGYCSARWWQGFDYLCVLHTDIIISYEARGPRHNDSPICSRKLSLKDTEGEIFLSRNWPQSAALLCGNELGPTMLDIIVQLK